MEGLGLAKRVALYNKVTRVRMIVHGDEFIMSGGEAELWKVHDELAAKHMFKTPGLLGPGESGARLAAHFALTSRRLLPTTPFLRGVEYHTLEDRVIALCASIG